jgi:hypothetical protein
MAQSGINNYVITFRYEEKGLSDLAQLNNQLALEGFSTTLKDEEGKIHELGSNSFGYVGPQDAETIRQRAIAMGHVALGVNPDVEVTELAEYLQTISAQQNQQVKQVK